MSLGPLLILAEDEQSYLSQVSTAHLIRLIIIITVFPFIVNSLYTTDNLTVVETINSDQNVIELIKKTLKFVLKNILQKKPEIKIHLIRK